MGGQLLWWEGGELDGWRRVRGAGIGFLPYPPVQFVIKYNCDLYELDINFFVSFKIISFISGFCAKMTCEFLA